MCTGGLPLHPACQPSALLRCGHLLPIAPPGFTLTVHSAPTTVAGGTARDSNDTPGLPGVGRSLPPAV
jgi:hypothetical protein